VHEQASIADFYKANLLMHLGFDKEDVLSFVETLVYEQASIADFYKANLLMHLGFDKEDVLSIYIGLSKH